MIDGRLTLVSGRCTIRGSMTRLQEKQDITYHLVFDASRSSLLLRKEDGPVFVRTREFQYCVSADRSSVKRIPLSRPAQTPIVPFDIRGLGILAYPSISVLEVEFLDFENLADYLLTSKIVGYQKDGNVAKLTVRIPKRPKDHVSPLYRLWIDTKRGHSLVRFEQLDGDVKPPTVLWWSELDWKEHGRVWVPAGFRQSVPHATPFSASWTIEWEQVNESVSAEDFALEKFVPAGKAALLYTVEKPSNNVVALGKIDGPVPAGSEHVVPRTVYFNWAKAMYVTGIALIIIACLIVMRRRWHR